MAHNILSASEDAPTRRMAHSHIAGVLRRRSSRFLARNRGEVQAISGNRVEEPLE